MKPWTKSSQRGPYVDTAYHPSDGRQEDVLKDADAAIDDVYSPPRIAAMIKKHGNWELNAEVDFSPVYPVNSDEKIFVGDLITYTKGTSGTVFNHHEVVINVTHTTVQVICSDGITVDWWHLRTLRKFIASKSIEVFRP